MASVQPFLHLEPHPSQHVVPCVLMFILNLQNEEVKGGGEG